MSSDFAKVFERKVWRVQVAHLYNAARALSSLSRGFKLSKNFDKDSFRYLWYCGKEQIECRLAWHWWKFHWFGVMYMFFTNQNAEIVACILSFRKSRHEPNKVLPNMVFARFGGEKMPAFWACACKLSWTLFSPARGGFSPYMGREERRVQGLD